MITRKLQKIGNSYMISLPPQMVQQLGWQLGEPVEVYVANGGVELLPKRERRSIAQDVATKLPKPRQSFYLDQEREWIKSGGYSTV